ncbi:L-seryl-tRNA selenium transferase, partial [Mesorhizobium sp. M00.F.Ca.ET.038.03.1.1]
MARLDPARIDALPHTADMPSEFIMMRAHRSSYDHAIRAAGAKIVDVGVNDRTLNAGIRGTDTWEIENAISEKTAGFAFMANSHNLRELEVWARLAQKYSLPVLVDAAPWLPPVENLRRFCDAGASLVAFSGGKAIRGPQASGI